MRAELAGWIERWTQAQKIRGMAMRVIAMAYAIGAALVLGSAAMAQNNPDQSSPGSSGSAQTTGQPDSTTGQVNTGREAPVGHRQPRAKDVPPGVQDNYGVRSPEDEALRRKLRICRDC
jgi:hypothetical protein